MAEPIMTLVDIHGAYAGQEREYSKTAGEIALANGFARLPDETDVVEPEGTPIGADFPGHVPLRDAAYETIESLPKTRAQLERIPGIGPATAGAILDAIGVGE